jgi:glycosyltransferase involved in cell wall biosynthesis
MLNKKEPNSIAALVELQKQFEGRKILHFGSLAGWPHTVARVSRELGIAAENVVHEYKDVLDLDRKLPYDSSVFDHHDKYTNKVLKTFLFLKKCHQNYSLVHYHSTTFLHREIHFLLEGPYLKKKGVPMVLSLGGGDARLDRDAKKRNKFYYKNGSFLHDLKIKMRWLSWSRNVAVCATDPEMAMIAGDYFDHVEIFRQPVELKLFPFCPPSEFTDIPLLLHVPTNPEIKGTDDIIRAVKNLKQKGLKFEFKMVRQLTQKDFFELLSQCDVYIDELKCGGHGMTAVESMAMGKPTISYIRDDLVKKYPSDLPLVKANPDTIEEVLEGLIKDAKSRSEIGILSRKYVEKYHDARIVMQDLSQIYLRLLSEKS